MQFMSAGQAVGQHCRYRPGQHLATDVVDGRGPARLFKWPCLFGKQTGINDIRGTQRSQVIKCIGLATQRNHLVTLPGEQVNGNTADTTTGTGHDDRPLPGTQTVLLQPVDGKRRRETGRSQGHGIEQCQARRQGHHPPGRHAHCFGVAAVMALAQPAAGHQHLVAC